VNFAIVVKARSFSHVLQKRTWIIHLRTLERRAKLLALLPLHEMSVCVCDTIIKVCVMLLARWKATKSQNNFHSSFSLEEKNIHPILSSKVYRIRGGFRFTFFVNGRYAWRACKNGLRKKNGDSTATCIITIQLCRCAPPW